MRLLAAEHRRAASASVLATSSSRSPATTATFSVTTATSGFGSSASSRRRTSPAWHKRPGIETRVDYFTAELASELRRDGLSPRVIHANNVLAHVPDIHDLVEGIAHPARRRRRRDRRDALPGRSPRSGPVRDDLPRARLLLLARIVAATSSRARHVDPGLRAPRCSRRIAACHGSQGKRRQADSRGRWRHSQPSPSSSAAIGVGLLLLRRRGLAGAKRDHRAVSPDQASGKSLAGYGAAAKATVLLNFAGPSTLTPSTTSWTGILPSRGAIIPGDRHPGGSSRTPPDRAPPDVVAVLVWNLADEVRSQLRLVHRRRRRAHRPARRKERP